ncbi:hypothetical protein ACIPJ1_13745 [Microbacterium maritypicum]|uniref:hypothetical protein n=1 Tax=Microbacterium maritypicum TaxID=33918 RepID=UPI00381A4A81
MSSSRLFIPEREPPSASLEQSLEEWFEAEQAHRDRGLDQVQDVWGDGKCGQGDVRIDGALEALSD